MSEQSGPFMQHMPCLQHGDLDDRLSAASTTIQHCSQTKRCLFAFKLCCAAYQRSTAPNLPLSLQTEISVCPFPTAHCQTSTTLALKPSEMLICCCCMYKITLNRRRGKKQEKEGILHNLRINLTEKYNQYFVHWKKNVYTVHKLYNKISKLVESTFKARQLRHTEV